VRRIISIIIIHRARSFAHTDVEHARVFVDAREIGGSHRAILVEQQFRPKHAPVVIEFLGFFQIADGVVNAVLLLLHQRRIQPGCWIVRIEFFGTV
jgi:hypothetical protein